MALRPELRENAFEEFVTHVEPKLRHALVAAVGRERGREATAEALAYAWEHWDDVKAMSNAAGYLYRVGRSRVRVRRRKITFVPLVAEGALASGSRIPDIEPDLPRALALLSERQRVAVFLIHAMGWKRREVADLLGISLNSVGSHLDRGLEKLRTRLGVALDE